MDGVDFQKLQHEIAGSLRSASRTRTIMLCVQIPIYIAALGWMATVFVAGFSAKGGEETTNGMEFLPYILMAMAGIMLASGVMYWAYNALAKKEKAIIKHLITALFPTSKLHKTPRGVNFNMIAGSKLFGKSADGMQVRVFNTLEMEAEGRKLTIADIGTAANYDGTGSSDSVAAYLGILKMLLRMITGARAENAMLQFRGMFTWLDLDKAVQGTVVILPDHIEDKLGYLAKNLQSLQNSRTEKLVTMEDPEFERYFAVYASNEVLARYVLTPVMMMRLTQLRERFGRDMMLSFNRGRFYFAVSCPDGLLSLRRKATKNNRLVEEIYEDISAAVALSEELRLDKIVKQQNK